MAYVILISSTELKDEQKGRVKQDDEASMDEHFAGGDAAL